MGPFSRQSGTPGVAASPVDPPSRRFVGPADYPGGALSNGVRVHFTGSSHGSLFLFGRQAPFPLAASGGPHGPRRVFGRGRPGWLPRGLPVYPSGRCTRWRCGAARRCSTPRIWSLAVVRPRHKAARPSRPSPPQRQRRLTAACSTVSAPRPASPGHRIGAHHRRQSRASCTACSANTRTAFSRRRKTRLDLHRPACTLLVDTKEPSHEQRQHSGSAAPLERTGGRR